MVSDDKVISRRAEESAAAGSSPGGLNDPLLQSDLEEVRKVSLQALTSASPTIKGAAEGLVRAGGKMLRPAMVVLAGRYGKFEAEKIYSLAAAVEMLHSATLVHDDIIDEAATRRGEPAVHSVYGNSQAVLIGDYLLSCSFTLAARSTGGTNGLSLAHAVARICEGEVNQNAGRFGDDFSIRGYRRRIAGKTAALFAMSLLAGARESGVDDEECSIFVRLGYNVGLAFQIIDDILDYTGDHTTVGKPLGRDLLEGIYTLPLLLALKKSGVGTPLGELVARKPYDKEGVDAIIAAVIQLGGIEEAKEEAALYTRRAQRELARLKPGYSRERLGELMDQLLKRDR